MIPESFIRDLLDRVDIVDVISRVVTLKKKGINWFGLCPFHHEKTGSFSVNQNKQFYKCFGCGAHGNAIGFLMQYKGESYPDAIRDLASEVGMAVPEEKGVRIWREKTESLADLMGRAQRFYEQQLQKSDAARTYLQGRQISEETQKKFALGFSPDAWQGLEAEFGQNYGDKRLEDCGLVIAKDGKRYDRFRGRVMFPIRNPRGQTIGFGARIMGAGEPKYLNSPETEIFKKGHEVYGLWEGREAVRKAGHAIVCEGYMDVIQLSQAGFGEAVAALGTAIGGAHIRKLFKIVPKIYFSFDGDAAGRHAARRALEQTLPVITDSQEARFILLPPEHDPDSLIKAEGPEAYRREMENSFRLSAFLIDSVREGKAMGTAEGRSQFLNEAAPLLQSMTQAPALQQLLTEEIAMQVRMDPADVRRLMKLPGAQSPARILSADRGRGGFVRSGSTGAQPAMRGQVRSRAVMQVKERMLRLFLSWPGLTREFEEEIENYLVGSQELFDRRILEVWRACAADEQEEAGGRISGGLLLELLAKSPDIEYYRQALSDDMDISITEDQARREIQTAFLKIAIDDLRERAERAVQQEPFDERLYANLTAQLKTLSEELQTLASGGQRLL